VIDSIRRINQESYIPLDYDRVFFLDQKAGVSEDRWQSHSQLIWNVTNIHNDFGNDKKWMDQFERIHAIIYCVDLMTYDEVLFDEPCSNRMMRSIRYFDRLINSGVFKISRFILFFCHRGWGEWERKVSEDPISNYFPNYPGENHGMAVVKYLLGEFDSVNRNKNERRIYPRICNLSDSMDLTIAAGTVKEIIIR
jgi:hypothetical protein